MSDTKDIVDYLRNRQKAAEIEAKVNGINQWVLLGAIAVISWQLIGSFPSPFWEETRTLISVIMLAAAAYLLLWVCSPIHGVRDDVRYFQLRETAGELSLLQIARGLVFIVPVCLHILEFGITISSLAVGVLGGVPAILGIYAIISKLFWTQEQSGRLPNLQFAPTRKSSLVGELIFSAAFAYAVYQQVSFLRLSESLHSAEGLKIACLAATCYLLVVVLVQRKLSSLGTLWTYELETDLLLGICSRDVALRKIEHRQLGPKLQDVMDRFLDSLDRKFSSIDDGIRLCKEQLSPVREIPVSYKTERASRINALLAPVEEVIASALEDCQTLTDYLKKLQSVSRTTRRPGIAIIIPHLISRQNESVSRLKAASAEVQAIRNEILQ